jgi:Fe-S cluster assembly protein SufB
LTVEWIDANTGSRPTMLYPAIYLRGERHGRHHQRRRRWGGQHQDTGAKAVHPAPNTKSRIVSKSVSTAAGDLSRSRRSRRAPQRRGQRPLRR